MPLPPSYCLDACVYIDWLTKSAHADLATIQDVIREVEDNQATLLVPVAVLVEILSARSPSSGFNWFYDFLKRSNVHVADLSFETAVRAEQLRSEALQLKPPRMIQALDAMIITTAMAAKVDLFLTTDKQLIQLSGNPIIESLTICLPRTWSGKRSLPGC
jgi:predicted nucleic acid-binding protein